MVIAICIGFAIGSYLVAIGYGIGYIFIIWIIFVSFGQSPTLSYPVIGLLIIAVTAILGGFSIFTTSKAIFLIAIAILYAGWIYVLAAGSGKITWSLVQFMSNLSGFLNRSFLFSWTNAFQILQERFDKFYFENNDIPPGCTFCWFWTFGDAALMVGIATPTFYYGGSLFLQCAYVIILFIIQLVYLFVGLIRDCVTDYNSLNIQSSLTQLRNRTSSYRIRRIQRTRQRSRRRLDRRQPNQLLSQNPNNNNENHMIEI